MKQFVAGIAMGALSILSTLLFVGIPAGTGFAGILTLVVFAAGMLLIAYLGLIKKNDKAAAIAAGAYVFAMLACTLLVELRGENVMRLAIGFLPGLVMSVTGLIRTKRSKDKYLTAVSGIVNILGLVLSVASFLLVIPNGGFSL